MSTKFFNNNAENTLFNKLKGIAHEMGNFDSFKAVAGYFRSSGYFKLRKELGDISDIRILVGINIDNFCFKQKDPEFQFVDKDKAKQAYGKEFEQDVLDANYSHEVEEGILQMCDDLRTGRLQMKIHPTKNLHAKFYLCLPENHTPNSDGWVIMGSSNISDSGLGLTKNLRYELNVAMKDYDDVSYCNEQFEILWEEGVPLSVNDVEKLKDKTYLGNQPSPYELYIKVLIDSFGEQVEDDFTIQLPDGVKDLRYQKDAVIQGYQILLKHNGLFLSDVVGLGKTMIATMIAKRYIEANGKYTSVLVIYPPALEENWKDTFKLFGIKNKAQFVTNGSLSKILEGKGQYKDKEEYDLVIVDEAHGFRNDKSGKYDALQQICKADCSNQGLLKSSKKRVMLLSATPLNNRPEDLFNQIGLFQDTYSCTIDGIPNLYDFKVPLIAEYKKLMSERATRDVTEDVDRIYNTIREKLINKITVRRTRHNILNDEDYKKDLLSQGIKFPKILPPESLEYQMDATTSELFLRTLMILSDEDHDQHIHYSRYRAIEFLRPEYRKKKYKNAEHIAQTLAGIYKVHMVKRLESSFDAFKKSLSTLLRITTDMIAMFDEGKVIIAPEMNVKSLQAKGYELDQIIELAADKGYMKDDIVFAPEQFSSEFIDELKRDRFILKELNENWSRVTVDPKFDLFKDYLDHVFMQKDKNPSGKLVVFSESVDTLKYLSSKLNDRNDVLTISASNRQKKDSTIKANFDANCKDCEDKYNIILTSDVLAEGVNLHRANVIVNYDSPWNATRLMQRIGRVNRIGSVANNIHNFMFYPSSQGDKEIQLYKNALIKLQGFHSAFGEDAQIYSREEIVKQFELYDTQVSDFMDKRIALLREVRELYYNNRKLYHKIKKLPMKSRVLRDTSEHSGKSIVFLSSNFKTEFYLVSSDKNEKSPKAIDFLDAVDYLKAEPAEKAAASANDEFHYEHVNAALKKYRENFLDATDQNSLEHNNFDKNSKIAKKFLRTLISMGDEQLKPVAEELHKYVCKGKYSDLPKAIKKIAAEYKADKSAIRLNLYSIQARILPLYDKYRSSNNDSQEKKMNSAPQIIISETFI